MPRSHNRSRATEVEANEYARYANAWMTSPAGLDDINYQRFVTRQAQAEASAATARAKNRVRDVQDARALADTPALARQEAEARQAFWRAAQDWKQANMVVRRLKELAAGGQRTFNLERDVPQPATPIKLRPRTVAEVRVVMPDGTAASINPSD